MPTTEEPHPSSTDETDRRRDGLEGGSRTLIRRIRK